MPAHTGPGPLRDDPQAAYPGYEELRKLARQRAAQPVDHREIPAMEQAVRDRGPDWCSSVLGYPFPAAGLRGIPSTDTAMLMIAHEQGLMPPEPAWLAEQKEQESERRREREAAAAERHQRDLDRWRKALERCEAKLEVREDLHGSRYGTVLREGPLRHAVPLADVRSDLRLHLAGRALCETARRSRPRALGRPVDEPANCRRCIEFAPRLRAGSPDGDADGRKGG